MQIDFHHGATYAVARLAGFEPKQANIIAHAAQYVDDATDEEVIRFNNGALYKNIASAHRMLDYRNTRQLANHHVWIPFHFLPGNENKAAGDNPDANFVQKIICCPDSHVAQDVFQACMAQKHQPFALHRLGVFSHVFIDTWAHQGFAGISHQANEVRRIKGHLSDPVPQHYLYWHYFHQWRIRLMSRIAGGLLPLGHGGALNYPDLPFLVWRYQDAKGNWVYRNNPRDYLQAMERLYQQFVAYIKDAPVDRSLRLPRQDRRMMVQLIRTQRSLCATERHLNWLKAIDEGGFSFGAERVQYQSDEPGSWKEQALGTFKKIGKKGIYYRPEVLFSDWKLFHDALQAHRFDVIHSILPRYNIMAA